MVLYSTPIIWKKKKGMQYSLLIELLNDNIISKKMEYNANTLKVDINKTLHI